MKKLFTLAAAVLASISLWAGDPTSTLDVATAAGSNDYYLVTLDANIKNNATWFGYNSSGSGSSSGCLKEDGYTQSMWKINSSRTVSFKVQNCDKIFLHVEFQKDATETVSYKIGSGSATAFLTNGSDKKICRGAEFSIGTADEVIVTISANNDILLGYAKFYPAAVTPSTDPVVSAEISGEDACLVGASVELTCNADKATTYQWSLNGAEIEGATAKKYTFTPTAAGEFSFTCAASNDYTETPVVAAAHVVTVMDPDDACGELIKAVLNGGTSATMSGVLGGTFDSNLGSGKYKLDKGKYIGVKLAAGEFLAGDTVIVTMTVTGQNYPCLFADKDRNTCLYLATETSEALEYRFILPAAANGLTALYLSRGDDTDEYKWNPTVSSISVRRSCEKSDNAKIAELTINGESVEAKEGVYSYAVGASVELATVEVVYTLEHPKATATPASGFTVNVPAAGEAANTQVITVTAQDGTTQATYTVSVTKSAEQSHDATLKALSVEGYTLDPEFAADVYAYTITKAYGAENPAVSAVHATANDANAQTPVVALNENAFTITVTAEDGETKLNYTISIVEADAKKDLLQVTFSNGVHGYILNGNIQVPYLAGEAEPTFVSAEFWNPDGEPTAEVVDDKLVVTGADSKTAEYTFEFVELTPMGLTYDLVTFTEVPSYIFSVYGWDSEKGVKFSKDVEEASNHRVSEGKDRIYIALPAAKSVNLTSGTAANREVIVTVNGVVGSVTKTAAANAAISIALNSTQPNLVSIESNGSNGDGGFIKMQLQQDYPTALDNTEDNAKAIKTIENGQIVIIKNGVRYNVLGAELR